MFDRDLKSIPSLFVLNVGQTFGPGWKDPSRLPDTMNVGPLTFVLRGVLMGSLNHFISMVLVGGLWLFYDGLGNFRNDENIPYLRVLDRHACPEALKYFTLTCIFFEVYPYDIMGEGLMCKESSSTVDHHNDDQFDETAVDHAAAEAMTESVSELSTRPMKLL